MTFRTNLQLVLIMLVTWVCVSASRTVPSKALTRLAHFNLRDRFLPYKSLIGQVTLDKNPTIRTVINKTETLNSDNEYRLLDYEVIAGEPNLEVEVREASSVFRFDYSKVFWNSRLGTEHQRLVDKFMPGEAVCDAMAGVGPFAIPAGKKGVFVRANDLNPDCYQGLLDATVLNKVIRINSVDSWREANGHTDTRLCTRLQRGWPYLHQRCSPEAHLEPVRRTRAVENG